MESLHAFLARIGTRNRTGAPASGTASCCASVVAQTAVSAVSRVANPPAVRRSNASPISNRRYGRLATCATEQRFMESLHVLATAHWDPEPVRRGAPASGTAPCCASVVTQTAVSAVSRVANPLAVRRSNASPISNRRYSRLATCATEHRFMESLDDFDAAHWDHEPLT